MPTVCISGAIAPFGSVRCVLTAKFEPWYTFGYELVRRPFRNGRPG